MKVLNTMISRSWQNRNGKINLAVFYSNEYAVPNLKGRESINLIISWAVSAT